MRLVPATIWALAAIDAVPATTIVANSQHGQPGCGGPCLDWHSGQRSAVLDDVKIFDRREAFGPTTGADFFGDYFY